MGQMADLGPRRLLPLNQGPVNVCTTILYVPYITLFFEDADGGQHGVVSQWRLLRKRFQHLLNGRWPFLPQHIHKPEFGFSESYGFARRHEPSSILRLLDAMKAKTSTNYLVAWDGALGCIQGPTRN